MIPTPELEYFALDSYKLVVFMFQGKVGIIVQARIGSSRLPGKVVKTVLGRPLLEYQLKRLKRTVLAEQVIVATTVEERDDPIIDVCSQTNTAVFRGSEDDVLRRYLEAAKEYHLDIIVRITADCPLIDPEVVDQGVAKFLQLWPEIDYVSNCHPRTFPRGMDTEIFSFAALEKTDQLAKKSAEREHVTLYMYDEPGRFRIENFSYSQDYSSIRLTVDTEEDFVLIKKIIESLYPKKSDFTLEDVLYEYPF